MAISKIKLPDNTTQDFHDSRIPGVDTTVTSGSSNVITSGAVYTSLSTKQKTITVSSSEPTSSDGSNGDIWIVI